MSRGRSGRACKVPRRLGFVPGALGSHKRGSRGGWCDTTRFSCSRVRSGRSVEDAQQEGKSRNIPGKAHEVWMSTEEGGHLSSRNNRMWCLLGLR